MYKYAYISGLFALHIDKHNISYIYVLYKGAFQQYTVSITTAPSLAMLYQV